VPRRWFAWTPVAQPALLAFGAAFAVLAARLVLQPNAIGRGFLWALVATFLALNAAPTIYFATAGLVLVVAVIEASYVMAYHDGLTGLPARRALHEALLRAGRRYTVAMVDVDHFKQFNDRYGHDVGDQVLRMVGAALAQVSGGGKAFRYGGEEFALVFSGRTVDECAPHLEELRRTVEATTGSTVIMARSESCPMSAMADTAAASSTNGTVGSPGSATPISPSPRLAYASSHQAQRQRRTGAQSPARSRVGRSGVRGGFGAGMAQYAGQAATPAGMAAECR